MKTPSINGNVTMWLAEPLPADVRRAIERLARADDVARIAIMPDVHLAGDVCVGTVLATRQTIYPAAVGGDIGCGMAALAFDADANLLRDAANAARLLMALPAVVPAMRHAHRDEGRLSEQWFNEPLSHPRLESVRRRDGLVQFATLGRGNHFLEMQTDEENRLWLMVHSGSRAMGPAIRDHHLSQASDSASRLRGLPADSSAGQAYRADSDWARQYARESRRAMADAVAGLLDRHFHVAPVRDSYFDCDHNHVRRETHQGEDLWVHRKGAASAGDNEPGIIPGSMGRASFHVLGRGCEQSLCSSSHGAGRRMSRTDAQRAISSRDLIRQLEGVRFDERLLASLREEAPAAYKDIHHVMRAQRELTRIVRTLRPLLSYKGG